MFFHFHLFFFLGISQQVASFGDMAKGMTSDQRRATVRNVFDNDIQPEPELFKRRRLGQRTDRLPNQADLHAHFNYHYDVSVQSNLLRAFGFGEEDGVPPAHKEGSQLTKGFHNALKDLAMYHSNLESFSKHGRYTFQVNTNGVLEASIPKHFPIHDRSADTHPRHLFHVPGVTDMVAERYLMQKMDKNDKTNRKLNEILLQRSKATQLLHPMKTKQKQMAHGRLLGECLGWPETIRECGERGLEKAEAAKNKVVDKGKEVKDSVKSTAGNIVDGIKSLGDDGRGDYKNECVTTPKLNEGTARFSLKTKCKLAPISIYQVIPLATDIVVESDVTYTGETCTCESCVYKPGGVPHDDIGRVEQKWCKCSQKGSSKGMDVENYALLGPVCPDYPSGGLSSFCEISNAIDTFPKVISCKFSVVLFRGVDITLETSVKLGFGGAGEDSALAADMYIGVATSKLPRGCWGADTVMEILPDPSDLDLRCRSLRMLSQALNKLMDVGETLGAGKHTLELYPFRFRWPNTYFPEGEGYMPGKGVVQSIMKHMARLPVQIPRWPSDMGGLCIDVPNTNLMAANVCMASIGESFKRPGPKKNGFRYLSVVFGLLGSDTCMETPDMKVNGYDLEMGLKLTHTLFDPEKVNVMKLLDLIPPAWDEMIKNLPGNENEKGMKTLLTEALETKPLKDLPNPLNLDWVNSAKGWCLKDTLNNVIKLMLPKKKIFEFNVGEEIAKGLTDLKTPLAVKKLIIKDPERCQTHSECGFIFPAMFKDDKDKTTKRRRDGGMGNFNTENNEDDNGGRRRRLHPLRANIINIPSGVQLQTTPHLTARRLSGVSIPSDVFTKKGGSCSITTGDDFPKTITCNVEMLIRPAKVIEDKTLPEITANMRAQVELAYSLDGKTLSVIVRAGANVNIPPIEELNELPQALRDTLATLDVGALIGRDFVGMIGLVPPTLIWPSPILEGQFREIARANLTTLRKEGLCLTNLHRLKPDREATDDYASLLGTLQAFAHLIGGDLCAHLNRASISDGFKTDFTVKASLFDPNKVKVWPVINTVFERVPQLRLLRPLIEKVLPIVAGKTNMNEVEQMLVAAVSQLYPDPMSVHIDVGKLITKGIELARKKVAKNSDAGGSRRRLPGSKEGGSWMSVDGEFNLGHIPASDRKDGGFEGSGKSCGWDCGTFRADGTFGPPPPLPEYARTSASNISNTTRNFTQPDCEGWRCDTEGRTGLFIGLFSGVLIFVGICIIVFVYRKKQRMKKSDILKRNPKRVIQVVPKSRKGGRPPPPPPPPPPANKKPGALAWTNEAWKPFPTHQKNKTKTKVTPKRR